MERCAGRIGKVAGLALLTAALGMPLRADGFRTVTERGAFLDLVQGRQLTRLGIRLDVLASGGIRGKAFGKPVIGVWHWRDGHFCRDLSVGREGLDANCQVVKVRGDTVRFIADKGAGASADLELR
ncbi:MAG: dihydrodipicolinate reductase [Rhodobacter sp.]|nr:dihydrodipicolinate reductase [Rhodobacter sp.]